MAGMGSAQRFQAVKPVPQPDRANTCAVLVTYHPDAGLPERVDALAKQLAHVIVVDNGSGMSVGAMLDQLEAGWHVRTVRNPENQGIATALNQGLAEAVRIGCAWAITLDQDSEALPEFASILFETFRAHPDRARIGAIGTGYGDPGVDLGGHQRQRPPGAVYLDVRTVITSGCLTSLAAWQQVGPFRDEFFIDCVDEEYCLRLRRQGWLVVMAVPVGLVHRLGDLREYGLLGRRFLTTNHSSLRRYYMTRNAFTLMAAQVLREPLWVARKLQRQLIEWLGILLQEQHKGRKLRAIALGLRHALCRRTGPLSPRRKRGLRDR